MSLKTKRLIDKNKKKIQALDKTEKIHLPPEQRYSFHYLSSEYLALTKIVNFITRGRIYDPKTKEIITEFLLEKQAMLANEFNLLHGLLTGESFSILPKDVDSEKMNISIHNEIVSRVGVEYLKMSADPNYKIDKDRYSKSTIKWLELLVYYRKMQPQTCLTGSPAHIVFHLLQEISMQLPDIIESVVDGWLPEDNLDEKVNAINSCLYYYNNFILTTVIETPSYYFSQEAHEKLNSIENEDLVDIDEASFLLRMFIFQEFTSKGSIDINIVKNILVTFFRNVLDIHKATFIKTLH